MKRLICCGVLAFAAGSAVAQARPDANTAKIFKGYSLTELTASGLLYNPQAKATYYKALGPLVKEPWLAKLDGPSNEFRPVKVAGADYMLGGTCKNHDCYDLRRFNPCVVSRCLLALGLWSTVTRRAESRSQPPGQLASRLQETAFDSRDLQRAQARGN